MGVDLAAVVQFVEILDHIYQIEKIFINYLLLWQANLRENEKIKKNEFININLINFVYKIKKMASSISFMIFHQKSDYYFINKIIAKLLWLCFRKIIFIEYQENLDKAPCPIIFAYNHNNYYETVFLCSYLVECWRPGKISFLVDWMYGNLPVLGWLLQGLKPVYVYTKRARWDFLNRQKAPANGDIIAECLERLRQGRSLGIFPEGTRNGNPFQLKRGRRGVGEIVLRSQRPVMPVGIDFPQRNRGRIPSFGKIIFRFGKPLHFLEEIAAWRQASQDSSLRPEWQEKIKINLANLITYKIMTELANLSGKQYPFRQPAVLTPAAVDSGRLDNRESQNG